MKPASFKYAAAETIEGALEIKARYGDEAKFLAGGQSLIPAMNFRLAQPAVLIDINPLEALAGVAQADAGTIRIGALTRYRALQRDATVAHRLPLLHEALPNVAHPQIRNRGTIGGNLAHADPASELPAVMLALGARLHARSATADRWITAADFFVGTLTTALRPDELLIEIELPALRPRTGTSFQEVARRRGDYAMMGVACTITLGDDGSCVDARLAYCSAGDTPMSAPTAAGALIGRPIDDTCLSEAVALARRDIDPRGSVNANADFQRHLAGVLTRRVVRTAMDRALAGVGARA